MSTSSTTPLSTRTARFLAICAGLWLLAHAFVREPARVPAPSDLVAPGRGGALELVDRETAAWYLTQQQLDTVAPRALADNARLRAELTDSVRTRAQRFYESTEHSCGRLVAALESHVDAGRVEDARNAWSAARRAISPATWARYEDGSDDRLDAELAELQRLEREERGLLAGLRPAEEPGFLWVSPRAARWELMCIASLAALLALTLRRRALERKGHTLLRRRAFGHAAGVLVALVVWSLVRPRLEFASYDQALVIVGVVCGFGFPHLLRALARLAGKDPERGLKRERVSTRKARIVTAMHDLRPGSFAELKRTAAQLAAELVAVEAEEGSPS